MITLKAPAKINWRLSITGLRENGYHDLQMIMLPLALADEVTLSINEGSSGVTMNCSDVDLPTDGRNLCVKAAVKILEAAGSLTPISIFLDKRVPSGAGLGGGSSDAAAVLVGLNRLLQLGMSREKLAEIGVSIGADVPFFLYRQPAIAEGIGEKITIIQEFPHIWIVLVNPAFEVPTPWAYKQWDLQLTAPNQHVSLPRSFRGLDEAFLVMENDLETVVQRHHPEVSHMKERLKEAGARRCMMTGSGPTVFGVFESQESSERAAECLRSKNVNWKVFATKVTYDQVVL